MIFDELCKEFAGLKGETGFYFSDLTDGEVYEYNSAHSFDAASVIKLSVMATVFDSVKNGDFSLSTELTVKESEKVPSCGAVKYIPEGTKLPVLSLVQMMITISDNTATNMLINLVSIDKINAFLEKQGIHTMRINRRIFDGEAAARGISNRITLSEVAILLKKIYEGTLVDARSSAIMLETLCGQQIKHKIPSSLPRLRIAHKTGEDSGESHDVALVLCEHPYIICFASEHTDVYQFERRLREASGEIYRYVSEKYNK